MEEKINSGNREVEITEPIIINMGKQKRKRIKNLMKGRGKLWFEVEGAVDEVIAMIGDELSGNTIVPLVLVYRRKPKRKLGIFGR